MGIGIKAVTVLICVGCIVSLVFGCGSGEKEQNESSEVMQSRVYCDEYYAETVRILHEMWDNEQDHISSIADKLAETIRSGRTVVWDANAGHHAMFECDPALPCLPANGMLSSTDFSGNREAIDNLKKGDILVTNYVNEQTAAAHDRGAYVVGMICSYFRNARFGTDILKANYNDLILDDISDEVFNTHMTEQMGLVSVPYIPEMNVGPGCGTFSSVVYWLMVSEVANRLDGDNMSSLEIAPQYMDTLFDRLEKGAMGQRDDIISAAEAVAERIGAGHHMWVESEPRGVLSTASGMSMGLIFTNRFPKEDMAIGDVMFIADVTSDPDSKMVREARAAREKGLFIVASCPETQTALREIADISFDNLSPEGYGVFDIEGQDRRIALIGSVVNNVIYNMFAIQMTQEMNKRGWYPKYFMSYIWQGASAGYFQYMNWVVNRVGY